MTVFPAHIPLALRPTPLELQDRLSEAWGGPRIWFKRDDLTGFELSGNKIRKLEFHFASARECAADTIVTCGAIQSNHCRATALAAARLGLRAVLLLRTPDGRPPERSTGNHLLASLAGADIRFVTPDQYRNRGPLMEDVAAALERRGRTAWIIPEGASDEVGMWGFVLAAAELREQLALTGGKVAAVWHPASSGGTTAGLGWGANRLGVDAPLVAVSVGEPAAMVEERVAGIWDRAAAATGSTAPTGDEVEYVDRYVGGGYGVVTEEELAVQVEATALTGVLFDPTYTGKAVYGLRQEISRGRFDPDDDVVFWHTGGGFAAFAHDYGRVLVS